MYQNIYVEKTDTNPVVHIWDDIAGKIQFPFKKYAYRKAKNGSFLSMYGDKLEKITNFGYDDDTLFESDVPVETRVLIDMYGDSDDTSINHRLLIFDIEVSMAGQLPDTTKAANPITAISMYDAANDKYWVLIVDVNGTFGEKKVTDNVTIIPFETEEELLEYFLTIYVKIAPTILTGWNIHFFDVPYLYNRLCVVLGEDKANLLSPIGKVYYHPYKERFCIAGISCLDYLVMYKKFNYSVEPSYRLDAIGKKEVGMGKVEYKGTLDTLLAQDIETFIKYSLTDVKIVKALDDKLQFIELCRSVCHVGHVAYEEIWYSSKYLEGALLLYLRRNGLIAPNKKRGGREAYEELKETDEEGFTGAYVKEPIPGKYEWVFSCDVNSLYPSAIRTLNISPETKAGKILNWAQVAHGFQYIQDDATLVYQFEDDRRELTKSEFFYFVTQNKFNISSNGVLYSTEKVGIIPAILTTWFAQRKEYQALKKKAKDDGDLVKMEFYNKRQHVQKILLNSLYGTLGLATFRFYDLDNAEAVTLSGQDIIKMTEKFANKLFKEKMGKKYKITYDDGTEECKFQSQLDIDIVQKFIK
jgi:DNA polymerase elongation subunit (family B)